MINSSWLTCLEIAIVANLHRCFKTPRNRKSFKVFVDLCFHAADDLCSEKYLGAMFTQNILIELQINFMISKLSTLCRYQFSTYVTCIQIATNDFNT